MFVHAEEVLPELPLDNKDITLFVRLGTDFVENYYVLFPWIKQKNPKQNLKIHLGLLSFKRC